MFKSKEVTKSKVFEKKSILKISELGPKGNEYFEGTHFYKAGMASGTHIIVELLNCEN